MSLRASGGLVAIGLLVVLAACGSSGTSATSSSTSSSSASASSSSPSGSKGAATGLFDDLDGTCDKLADAVKTETGKAVYRVTAETFVGTDSPKTPGDVDSRGCDLRFQDDAKGDRFGVTTIRYEETDVAALAEAFTTFPSLGFANVADTTVAGHEAREATSARGSDDEVWVLAAPTMFVKIGSHVGEATLDKARVSDTFTPPIPLADLHALAEKLVPLLGA
jgi:hypothetical protein